MTQKINNGGPAYPARPTEHLSCGGTITAHHGMTKREVAAIAAMQGILSGGYVNADAAPGRAVEYADALIAALGEGQ